MSANKLPEITGNYRIGYVLFLRVLYIGVLQTTYYTYDLGTYLVAGVRTTIPYIILG